ncbi:MAG: hypothetical protein WCX88_03855 [Patescibacteria group bacterium]
MVIIGQHADREKRAKAALSRIKSGSAQPKDKEIIKKFGITIKKEESANKQ